MATRRPAFAVPVAEFAATLLSQQEVGPRARAIAEQCAPLLPGTAIVIYIIEDQENPRFTPKATLGEITVADLTDFEPNTLRAVMENKSLVLFESGDLPREHYSHLDVRRTVEALAYVPLLAGESLIGAIEVISYEQSFPESMLQALQEIAELAAPAVAAALSYERERNISLQSISRVTQMYDLEKVFNSTLEMDELLETIAKKFQEVMNVQGVNLWMVDGDGLRLTNCAGSDPTVHRGMMQNAGEGIAGDISDSGEGVFIADPHDERLQKRNADHHNEDHEDEAVFSLLAAPLMEHENLVGVAEAVNRLDGQPFDEDDEFLLTNICETASNALHNASLLQAERKVEILEALVKVSGEITSTLDLDRVLDAIVNGPASVLSYDRATIALEQRGRIVVRAITGMPKINPQDPDVERLQNLLEWTSLSNEPIFIVQRGDTVEDEREATRAKFETYFAQTGMRAFHALPLTDDDGLVGVFSLESSDPEFLNTAHLEMIKVLAAQATVALRNASMYREVPFINVLQPLLQKKRKFMALQKSRRLAWMAAVALVLIFLGAVPLPLRVDGPAVVAPLRSARIEPAIAGVIDQVNVREGQTVQRGQVLGTLADWRYRTELAAAQAKYQTAISQMNRALAANDGAEGGIERGQADYWISEVNRAKERMDQTIIRSPIDGIVATPHIEDSVGRNLNPGDTFAEIVDTSRASVDVAIDQYDVALLKAGQKASVKLEGYPLRTFRGELEIVSPKSQLEGEQRLFFARVNVPNTQGLIHPGMQGQSKISTGWSAAGRVMFRHPAMWLWAKLWSWFGW
jgi:RND family efflux transporter MFP subunit